MIVFCQGSYFERAGQTEVCLKTVHNYVDRIVLIYDETYPQSKIDEWKKAYAKLDAYFDPWKDSMPEMRNTYLSKLEEGDWALVSDPDEVFDEHFLRNLRLLIENAERNGVNQLLINSHDVDEEEDGTLEEGVSDFFKALLFKIGGDAGQVYYMGVGLSKNVHETLCGNWRPQVLPKEYFYRHYKKFHEVWERGFRNFWMGGGGNNVGPVLPNGQPNKPWFSLRAITDRLGLKRWGDVREYMRKGNIDEEFKRWLIDNRNWNDVPDMASEIREGFKWYKWLHPEEFAGLNSNPQPPLMGSWGEVRQFVHQCYREVLGRDSDEEGREFYTQAILSGKLKREELPNILRQSQEYKKFGSG